jgi:hypothetical protein
MAALRQMNLTLDLIHECTKTKERSREAALVYYASTSYHEHVDSYYMTSYTVYSLVPLQVYVFIHHQSRPTLNSILFLIYDSGGVACVEIFAKRV